MTTKKPSHVTCSVCGRQVPPGDVTPGELIRSSVADAIRRDHPEWPATGPVCLDDLNHYRAVQVQEMMREDRGELTTLDEEVLRSVREHELVSQDVNSAFEQQLTAGQRIADGVASFGGSWRFIIIFGAVMFIWIALNSSMLMARPFDPFPFILLNLVLSCLAAIQAPVIMMSQNRQESKDRLRADHDYRVNLKAELEIRLLTTRFDHLLSRQWQRLLEIQQIQTELMEEIATHRLSVE
jgi:uncharacterized membrane protein